MFSEKQVLALSEKILLPSAYNISLHTQAMALHGVHTTWQIKKKVYRMDRWLDMDDWFDAQTELFFRQYHRECQDYLLGDRDVPVTNRFETSFTSSKRTGTITYLWDFTGLMGHRYTLKNLLSGEENEIRFIRYEVLDLHRSRT